MARDLRARTPEIAILLGMLAVLTVILFAHDLIVRNRRLYRRTRLAFLTVTLVFLGGYAAAQLSVVNVVTFVHALLAGFRWEQFLLDPLVFILWSFLALALLFWGRGVFCGWLCPFGALQELTNQAARKLGVRQYEVPWAVQERLWPLKYALFLAILGLSFHSARDALALAEVEPFKTAIVLKFDRAWPFVLFAVALLVAGLFIERFFCRYLCRSVRRWRSRPGSRSSIGSSAGRSADASAGSATSAAPCSASIRWARSYRTNASTASIAR